MNGKKLAVISFIAAFAIQLVIWGIAWGTTQTRISELEKDMDGMPADLAVIKEKVGNIEDAVREIRDTLRPPRR